MTIEVLAYPTAAAEKRIQEIVSRRLGYTETAEREVADILAAVQREGDGALVRYTRAYDAPEFTEEQIRVSAADLARVKERAAQGACVLGLRFTRDPAVPGTRFDALRRELGEAFLAVEIDSSPGNPWGIPRRAHSVLTNHFVDEPGHPTREALDRVLAFFAEHLHPGSDS